MDGFKRITSEFKYGLVPKKIIFEPRNIIKSLFEEGSFDSSVNSNY